MRRGSKNTFIQTKGFCEPVIFVSSVAGGRGCVDGVVEIGVGDVDFPGRDADYGSVLLVKADDFKGILAAEEEVVVGFVSKGVSGRFGAREGKEVEE